MPGALDRDGQGALLASVAVGLAPVGDLAPLVEAAPQTLDILVVDDLAGSEDGLLAAASAATEAAAATTATLPAIATAGPVTPVAVTGAVATATGTATEAARTVATTGPVTTTLGALATIGAVTAGGTLGTGGEPGAGTLVAGRATLLACLRRISHWSVYSLDRRTGLDVVPPC